MIKKIKRKMLVIKLSVIALFSVVMVIVFYSIDFEAVFKEEIKEKVEEVKEQVREKVEEKKEDVKQEVDKLKDSLENKIDELEDKIKNELKKLDF